MAKKDSATNESDRVSNGNSLQNMADPERKTLSLQFNVLHKANRSLLGSALWCWSLEFSETRRTGPYRRQINFYLCLTDSEIWYMVNSLQSSTQVVLVIVVSRLVLSFLGHRAAIPV